MSPDKVQQLAFEDNMRHSSRILDAQSGHLVHTVCGKQLRVAHPRDRYGLPICGACLNRGSG